MKAKAKWSNIVKQTFIVVFGMVCMVGLMGCGGDDGGGDGGINLQGTWRISVTGLGLTETYDVPFPAELSDVSQLPDITVSIILNGDQYVVTISENGKAIYGEVYFQTGDRMYLSGTVNSSTSMSGTGTYYFAGIPIGIPFTWSAVKN